MTEKEILLKAIDSAEGFGSCSYEDGCVVAQYFLLKGGNKNNFKYWLNKFNKPVKCNIVVEEKLKEYHILKPNIDLLLKIQVIWDNRGAWDVETYRNVPISNSPEEAKEKMREIVMNSINEVS